MSNALAIATVTTALTQIVRLAVQSGVPGSEVVTGRPDPQGTPKNRVHLFLYQVLPNIALRNADLPTRAADGKLVHRPMIALDLHYLLAFYGSDTTLETQHMLGAVVRDLHAKPVLTRQMITEAVANDPLTDSDLVHAVEQVKFTLLPLTLEELSKLWSVFFQIPYALSVAYQSTVVLIEAEERAQPALPVLRRGDADQGVDTRLGPFPVLESIHISTPEDADVRPRRPSLRSAPLGAVLTIIGRNLGGERVWVRFTRPPFAALPDILIDQTDRTATEIKVSIRPDALAPSTWAAGLYTVTVLVENGGTRHTSDTWSVSLAPQITSIAPNPIARDSNGNATVTITCSPQVLAEQHAVLLLANHPEITAEPHPTLTDTLHFVIQNAPVVTDTLVYLRVDGVDSLPFKRESTLPWPVFDNTQKVTIT